MIRVGCSHTEGPMHDCAYVDAVDKLIPRAEKAAYGDIKAIKDECYGGSWPDLVTYKAAYEAAFRRNMAELCVMLGLRREIVAVPTSTEVH